MFANKENDKTSNIPVIFVSALTGLEEKLKGYDVGQMIIFQSQ